ncbi:MAG: threonine synthase, partial [Gemmatimonadales bacterium]
LLPLDFEPSASTMVGWTPLLPVPTLSQVLGGANVWLKCDGFSHPSLSFKDRVVAVAINKARELGIDTVACPSTGNLANAVAAHAAAAGMKSVVLVPADIEVGKLAGTAIYHATVIRINGTYDQINEVIALAAEGFGWGVVNGNLRPYYAEGSKTVAYEIAEQLDWSTPDWVVAPMAGGSLINRLRTGFEDLERLGWISGGPRLAGAQAKGCAPIVRAFENSTTTIAPMIPRTAARSIAIGNPVDGRWAVQALRESGGTAAAVSDDDMRDSIALLAAATGVFTETAGGVTLAAARKISERGLIGPDDVVVLCLTGNGMKTVDAVDLELDRLPLIEPDLKQLEHAL